MEGSTTPAGWYADPMGRFELRYWTGTEWSERVSRAGQQLTDPLSTPPSASADSTLEGVPSATASSGPGSVPPTRPWAAAPAGLPRRAAKPPIYKRKGFLIGAAIVVALIIATAIAGGSSKSNTPKKTSSPQASVSTTGRGTTSAPSTTTTTLPPTTTTGIAAPVPLDGNGDNVVAVNPHGASILHAKYSGDGNFVIKALDANQQQTDLLVNVIGGYEGVVTLDFGTATTRFLQVNSSGPWHLDLYDARSAHSFTGAVQGMGDNVLLYSGPSGIAAITASGSGNFVVKEVKDTENLLVNVIGAYNGRVPWSAGPAFVVVNADGPWTITIGS
jgi:hypothetical protein